MKQTEWMQTHTGRQFWPTQPNPADVQLLDVAHALANICRYGGHTPWHYSVAQHSVLVAAELPADAQLYGLFHDAAEAYCGDVIRPIKVQLKGYGYIETRIEDAIWDGLSLLSGEPEQWDAVHIADNVALATEAFVMFPIAMRPGEWTLPEAPLPDPHRLIHSITPAQAESLWLYAYDRIITGIPLLLSELPAILRSL